MFTWNKTWEVCWFKKMKDSLFLPKKDHLDWFGSELWRWPAADTDTQRWAQSCADHIFPTDTNAHNKAWRTSIKHGGPPCFIMRNAHPIGGLRSTLSQAPQPNCCHEWCLFRTLSYPCSLKKCTGVKYTIFISSTPFFVDFDQYSHLRVFLGRISNLGYPPGLLNV